MKKASVYAILIALIVVIAVSSFCACLSSNFMQEDFELRLTSVEVDGNKVNVKADFKNKTFKSGKIASGTIGKISSIIKIEYKDANGQPELDYPAIMSYYYMKSKKKITNSAEFELQKGKYTIKVVVDIYCNKEVSHFIYIQEKEVEIV